jgi:excisionase family DNA binding protein
MSLLTGRSAVPDSSRAVLKVAEVARELRCSKNTIYELIRMGQLRALRIGERNIRLTREEVERYKAGDGQPAA